MEFEHTKQQLFEILSKNQWKIATAESCTGGLVAAYLCDISGISSYFEEGYITYSENAKIKNLNVLEATITKYGIVSIETAEEMAIGAAKAANADVAISTTGVAGPSGGTKETPVGCVCFGCTINGTVFCEQKIFQGNRAEIRKQAAEYALEFIVFNYKRINN